MASVYLARERSTARLVALKRAHPHVRADVMRTEARIASRVEHPNVVRVLDVEEVDGQLMVVLEYVDGCTLSDLHRKLAARAESHPRAMVRILVDVATGIHAAHRTNVVHRDVTPSNVLIGRDGVGRVSDFGIAKALFSDDERTETGLLKGKASYMAPEYVLHQQAWSASDLFSLGIVAWEALSGRRLFRGATQVETLGRVARAHVPPLGGPLEPVVMRALSRLPEDRQPTVEAFAIELATAAERHHLLASHEEVGALIARVVERSHDADLETLELPAVTQPLAVLPSAPRARMSKLAVPAVMGILLLGTAGMTRRDRAPAARREEPPPPPVTIAVPPVVTAEEIAAPPPPPDAGITPRAVKKPLVPRKAPPNPY
jgi:serine/threonine-protein kinase